VDGTQPEEALTVVSRAGWRRCMSKDAATREMGGGGVAARPRWWRRRPVHDRTMSCGGSVRWRMAAVARGGGWRRW
jgi:hypothetical protein